tara:strand:- start:12 stop:833 length:822 start_codon:yes stop_codon:yes gene_type:complete
MDNNIEKHEEGINKGIIKIHESMNGLATMTPDKIAKVSERMVEIDRAINTLGRKNTQNTIQLMTLNMMTDSPYRRLRQCIAEINKKRDALESTYFRFRKQEIELKKWESKSDELSIVNADEARAGIKSAKIYIDGALKEIAVLQEAYDEIRKNNNIPEEWDEMDAEMDEIKHHIRQAFRQSHRDMMFSGKIQQGNAEYLEQYGVHLQTATDIIGKYIATCDKLLEEGKVPNINHFYEFLDNCVEVFGEEYKNVMKHIGLDNIVRQEYLYRSTK